MKKTVKRADAEFLETYQAICQNGTQFEGALILAVKTTRIFCRPSCTARKPKPENVVFYKTTQEALQNGFRPCKICKPMDAMDETPPEISQLIKELHAETTLRIKDQGLRERGLEPAQIRRWFKKHHGITFHAYQRMLRLGKAYADLKKGQSVTKSAFENGYDSLSGFNESYFSVFGNTPTGSQKNVINITRLTTPLGPMFAGATSEGVCLLDFTDRKSLETEFKELRQRLNAVILPGENIHLTQLQQELNEYFAKKRNKFEVALQTPGTDFQREVWQALIGIPYGQTRSYKEQAILLERPEAVRAVASANGRNRVSIVIPCHRVIGADGQLTGYGGGLPRKQWLLDHEKS